MADTVASKATDINIMRVRLPPLEPEIWGYYATVACESFKLVMVGSTPPSPTNMYGAIS